MAKLANLQVIVKELRPIKLEAISLKNQFDATKAIQRASEFIGKEEWAKWWPLNLTTSSTGPTKRPTK